MARLGIFLLASILAACAPDAGLGSLEAGETGRVVRIIDGDALVLDTGLSVRLVGIEAPALGRKDVPEAPFAKEAHRALEDLTLGRRVQLYYPGLTRDRYDRALAHVKTIDDLGPKLWVNLALVEEGAARVRTYPDTAPLGDQLLAAEHGARDAGRGLWALRAYDLAKASQLSEDDRGFYIVEAVISGPARTERGDQLCAQYLDQAELRLVADPAAPSLCALPSGTPIEARGYVSRHRLYVTHDLNIQARRTSAVTQ